MDWTVRLRGDRCPTKSDLEIGIELLGNKTGVTRLRFAVLLKAFQFDGRFPDRRGDVAGSVAARSTPSRGASTPAVAVPLRSGHERRAETHV
jgi:hypothetical protein